MNKSCNIMIVGVGGQGSLLASKILGKLLAEEAPDVKVSEVHGMSQRGGSVVTYVRCGERVYSPVIDKGEADFIVSFEKSEAARYLQCLAESGTIIVNTREIDSMPVITGAAEYPHDILERLSAEGVRIDALDALSAAESAGSSKAVNLVLMGRLSRYFDIDEDKWLKIIEDTVPPKFAELNKKAFLLGRQKQETALNV